MHARRLVAAVALPLAALACQRAEPITSCEAVGRSRPICGFQNPEDLAALPDGRHLIVSEYGGLAGEPGRLALLDTETGERRVLFAGGGVDAAGPWGAEDCPGAPSSDFSPHGIHLGRRGDGRLQLLVVQHGGRESVEMFEVDRDGAAWQVAWRGCAVAPADSSLNDVVAVPEGGFLVTEMMSGGGPGRALAYLRASLFGGATGRVLAWQRASGFSELPGSRGAMPNGIELSADGRKVFLDLTLANRVARIDRSTGTLEAFAQVPHPDNLTWAADGSLRVASLDGELRDLLACRGIASGSCPVGFAILAVDPETMRTERVYQGGPGTPSGAGTVGLEANGALWIGSFASDRVVRVALEP